MGASETTLSQATVPDDEPSAQVTSDETQADIVPLFGDDDTFVERMTSDSERASTEPIWFDESFVDAELELVEVRRDLRKARSDVTESRCELARERARFNGLENALELAVARCRALEARCAAEIERAAHAEDRSCALAAQLAQQEELHREAVDELERQGAAAVAAAYLWFARLHR